MGYSKASKGGLHAMNDYDLFQLLFSSSITISIIFFVRASVW
jgi:hypothetical protein